MSTSICLRLSSFILLAALPCCGLVKAPFKVAGAVVDGTAYVGKKAAAPFKTTPEEKAQKEKEKAAKEAKEKKEAAEKAAKQGQPQVPGTPTPEPTPQPAPPPLPQSEGQVPANDFLPKSPDELPPPPR